MGFDWDVIMGVSSGSLFLDIIIIGRNSKANKFTKRLNDPPMNDFIFFVLCCLRIVSFQGG